MDKAYAILTLSSSSEINAVLYPQIFKKSVPNGLYYMQRAAHTQPDHSTE
jgi:hypothetical protein